MNKLSGACLCGQVSYHSDYDSVSTIICHCKHCQKTSGSAYSVNIAVPEEGLHISGDTLACYQDQGEKAPVRRYFCQSCGSPIYTAADVSPGMVVIKAGTLHDTSEVKPDLALWKEHKQNWVALHDVRAAKGNLFANPTASKWMVKIFLWFQKRKKGPKN